jgi:uncharacterized repeat protein (TIGR03803 family)
MKRSSFVLLAVLFASVACSAQTYTEIILYNFLESGEGYYQQPTNLVVDSAGNLYGAANLGGINNQTCGSYGCGTIFKFSTEGVLSTLYEFTGLSDGYKPCCLVMDKSGNLYGTTYWGGLGVTSSGDMGNGTVFKFATKTNKFSTLHEFGRVANDGVSPNGPLTLGSDGNLYGITCCGGSNGYGTIFEITPKGVETIKHDFSDTLARPISNVLRNDEGDFYGLVSADNIAGSYILFEVTSSGVEEVLNSNLPTQYGGGGFVFSKCHRQLLR